MRWCRRPCHHRPGDRGHDHVAAIVDLGDDAVGAVRRIGGDRQAGPLGRRVTPREVGQHIAVAVLVLAGHDDAGLVGLFAGRHGPIDGHDDRVISGAERRRLASIEHGQATKTIKLGTGVALVQQRDAIQTAKLVASLDQVSRGRFLFGIGGGWNQDEMEDHGTVYATRFKRVRESIEAMKEIWTKETA